MAEAVRDDARRSKVSRERASLDIENTLPIISADLINNARSARARHVQGANWFTRPAAEFFH
jgi:hypothetical protein